MEKRPRYYDPAPTAAEAEPPKVADICVYGATAAGVIAAVQARRLGLTVALLHPGSAIGGMTASGLGYTDFGNKAVVGGLAREFYRRVGAYYGKDEEWCFEPQVAEKVFRDWLREAGVAAELGQYVGAARRENGRIVELTTTSNRRCRADYYLDCSYEGDLLAAAGVSHVVGREGAERYGEAYNGQQVHATHQFDRRVDPYQRPGDPRSGLLPGIDPDSAFIPGAADERVQAYNFRVCMTRRPDLRVPFPRPEDYRRDRYELLARYLAAGGRETFAKFDRVRNGKTDTNNFGAFSTDFIGQSWAWPRAGYEERERIFQAHVGYQQGYHWFMANDPAVPAPLRQRYGEWGLAADEFQDSGHWPPQLYVREARRLLSEQMMTEKHCLGREQVADPIALGAYTMDSHNCRRFVHDGAVLNEGNVEIKLPRPYGVSYRAMLPRRGECANLLVPVCLGASHIAFGSIRMEPVFMALAQAAVTAASLARQAGRGHVADVPYRDLRARAEQDGQVLVWNAAAQHQPADVNESDMAAAEPPDRPPPGL